MYCRQKWSLQILFSLSITPIGHALESQVAVTSTANIVSWWYVCDKIFFFKMDVCDGKTFYLLICGLQNGDALTEPRKHV